MAYQDGILEGYVRNDPSDTVVEIDPEDIWKLILSNERDCRKGVSMTASTLAGENFYRSDSLLEFCRELIERDPMTDCFKVEYPHGTILEQSRRRHFYRGERQIYPTTMPTLSRKLAQFEDETDRELYRLVSDMRVYEFSEFINNFKSVREWDYCDVLYEPLAQHYGLETNWLDITNDFLVALFFATCVWEGNEWRPLTASEINQSECTRWGVIFHKPGSQVSIEELLLNEKYVFDASKGRPLISYFPISYPFPFGHQPFVRCSLQTGYGIYSRGAGSLQDDHSWEQLRFRQDEGLSRFIFDLMEGGKNIYPDESLDCVAGHLKGISQATQFSDGAFRYALARNHQFKLDEPEACLTALSHFIVDGRTVEIGKRPWRLGISRILEVDMKSDGERRWAKENIHVVTRPSINAVGMGIWSPWMLPEREGMPGVEDMQYRAIQTYDHAVFTYRWYGMVMQMLMTGRVPEY